MKKLLIFDFDGTLVDTITDAALCFNRALERYGFEPYPVSDYGRVVGGNLDVIFSKLLKEENRTEENIEKLKNSYREIYLNDNKPNTVPFDGITTLLELLKSKGCYIAINTNKAQPLVEDLCHKIFPSINFDGIVGFVEGYPSKPNPYGVNKLMSENKVTKEQTIYIGDGKTDIETAKKAGIDCIFVTWGQGEKNLIYDDNVSFIANSVEDLFRILN